MARATRGPRRGCRGRRRSGEPAIRARSPRPSRPSTPDVVWWSASAGSRAGFRTSRPSESICFGSGLLLSRRSPGRSWEGRHASWSPKPCLARSEHERAGGAQVFFAVGGGSPEVVCRRAAQSSSAISSRAGALERVGGTRIGPGLDARRPGRTRSGPGSSPRRRGRAETIPSPRQPAPRPRVRPRRAAPPRTSAAQRARAVQDPARGPPRSEAAAATAVCITGSGSASSRSPAARRCGRRGGAAPPARGRDPPGRRPRLAHREQRAALAPAPTIGAATICAAISAHADTSAKRHRAAEAVPARHRAASRAAPAQQLELDLLVGRRQLAATEPSPVGVALGGEPRAHPRGAAPRAAPPAPRAARRCARCSSATSAPRRRDAARARGASAAAGAARSARGPPCRRASASSTSSSSDAISARRRAASSASAPRLLVERLAAGALAGQLELGLAQVLLREQRALLELLEHAVGVGLHQRRESIERSAWGDSSCGACACRDDREDRARGGRAPSNPRKRRRGRRFTARLRGCARRRPRLPECPERRPGPRSPAGLRCSWWRTRPRSAAACATCSPSTATRRRASSAATRGCARGLADRHALVVLDVMLPGHATASTSAASCARSCRACRS